jgi:hypothetical protein
MLSLDEFKIANICEKLMYNFLQEKDLLTLANWAGRSERHQIDSKRRFWAAATSITVSWLQRLELEKRWLLKYWLDEYYYIKIIRRASWSKNFSDQQKILKFKAIEE